MNTRQPTDAEREQLKCLQDQTLAGRVAALVTAVHDFGLAWLRHIKKVL